MAFCKHGNYLPLETLYNEKLLNIENKVEPIDIGSLTPEQMRGMTIIQHVNSIPTPS